MRKGDVPPPVRSAEATALIHLQSPKKLMKVDDDLYQKMDHKTVIGSVNFAYIPNFNYTARECAAGVK